MHRPGRAEYRAQRVRILNGIRHAATMLWLWKHSRAWSSEAVEMAIAYYREVIQFRVKQARDRGMKLRRDWLSL